MQTTNFSTWSNSNFIPSPVHHRCEGAPCVINLEDQSYLFYRGYENDTHIYWSMYDNKETKWSEPTKLPDYLSTDMTPSVAPVGKNKLLLVFKVFVYVLQT